MASSLQRTTHQNTTIVITPAVTSEFLTEAVAVLCVEAGVVDEIYAAANHIACCKRRSIGLPSARRAEGMAIVSVIAIRVLVPT